MKKAKMRIRKAAVLGAGVMGSKIAALLGWYRYPYLPLGYRTERT